VAAPSFDLQQAHRYFSAECFNRAWDLIDKPSRTPAEDETMLQLGLSSLWHWSQRTDHTDIHLSVGHWQVARIYILLRKVEEARRHAHTSLELSQEAGDFPFYQGYAFEALARAEALAGEKIKSAEYLQKARELSLRIPDIDDKQQLLADLDSIG
jgi:hypothetical protein